MVFFQEKINRYTIENVVDCYSIEEYDCLQLFSYEEFSKDEFINIVENACKVICENYDEYDIDELIYDVHDYLLENDERFFDIKAMHAIEINTMCCEHAYKVRPVRSCCPSNK